MLSVQTRADIQLTAAILGHLNGANVGRVSHREPTLEDAYVALVQPSEDSPAPRDRLALPHEDDHAARLSTGVGQVIYPLFFATVAFFVFRAGDSPRTLLYASLGAAVMGMWSATSTTAGGAMQRERGRARSSCSSRTPTHFASSCSRDPRHGHDRDLQPGRDAPLGTLPVRDRAHGPPPAPLRASIVGNRAHVRRARLRLRGQVRPFPRSLGAREPLRVPRVADRRLPRAARVFPGWVRPISWVLAPTWGMNAIRESALGGSPVTDLLMCVAPRRPLHGARHSRHRTGAALRAGSRHALAVVTSLRLFFVGGLMSYRALFYWLTPQIYIPSLLVAPIFQILLFAYIGRSAGLKSDKFYVDRERAPVRGHPLPVRDVADDRRRALPEHPERDPRQPGAGGSRSSSGAPCR